MAFLPQSLDDDEVMVQTREILLSHFLLKIESFSLLSENNVNMYETTEFKAGGFTWRLIIYPNGEESEKKGEHVSVYLALADPTSLPARSEINADFAIFLHNQKLDKFLCKRGRARRFHTMKPTWGFSKFISLKSLMDPSNGYLVNKNCVFGAEVFVLESERVIERLTLSKAVTPTFKRTWRISRFSTLGDKWKSENFRVGEVDWKLSMYPRGSDAAKDRSISMFLELVNLQLPCQKVQVTYKVQINDQINGIHCRRTISKWFDPSVLDWGWSTFMSIEDMNNPVKGFLVEDCCIAEIEISVLAVARTSS